MGKKKEIEDYEIIKKTGENLNNIIALIKKRGIKISKEKVAEFMDVSNEQVSKFISGKNSPPFFRLYRLINSLPFNQTDLAYLFDLNITEEFKPKSVTPFFAYSDNPELNKNINLIRQIYDDGDEEAISGVEICLSGFFDKFIKKKQRQKRNKQTPKKTGMEGVNSR